MLVQRRGPEWVHGCVPAWLAQCVGSAIAGMLSCRGVGFVGRRAEGAVGAGAAQPKVPEASLRNGLKGARVSSAHSSHVLVGELQVNKSKLFDLCPEHWDG